LLTIGLFSGSQFQDARKVYDFPDKSVGICEVVNVIVVEMVERGGLASLLDDDGQNLCCV
jgi:hypothetical protein